FGQACGRCAKPQRLAGARIQLVGNGIELALAERPEVKAIRKVLAQQAVGVFIATALPRTAGIAEVDSDVRRHAEALVLRQLWSTVPRQRRHEAVGQPARPTNERIDDA